MTIAAKVICDSIANGIRLTTLELYYPRFIHSQFMTHRMFSRNASSSRAIPVQRNIDAVLTDPAIPIHWGKNQKGMQAEKECSKLITLPRYGLKEPSKFTANEVWELAKDDAIEYAEGFVESGYHKQIVNRLLEPFAHIKVIVTATEWEGFFKLRLPDDAQPEIQELARCMKEAMNNSIPLFLSPGEYHLPYIDEDEVIRGNGGQVKLQPDLIKASVARCARVSYLNHDNSDPDIAKDIDLADRLLTAGHMSPFEHIATPMEYPKVCTWMEITEENWGDGVTHADKYNNYWSGNFKGWIQYRQLVGTNHA